MVSICRDATVHTKDARVHSDGHSRVRYKGTPLLYQFRTSSIPGPNLATATPAFLASRTEAGGKRQPDIRRPHPALRARKRGECAQHHGLQSIDSDLCHVYTAPFAHEFWTWKKGLKGVGRERRGERGEEGRPGHSVGEKAVSVEGRCCACTKCTKCACTKHAHRCKMLTWGRPSARTGERVQRERDGK